MKTASEQLAPVYLKIAPENIVLVKSIIESYDDLGILRTLDADRGEIVVLAVSDTLSTLNALLESIKDEVGFEIIPPPPSLEKDWLMADFLSSEAQRAK